MIKKRWIKAGLIGALVYPILNVIFLLAGTCVYFGSHPGCLLVAQLYLNAFPGEMIGNILRPMDHPVAFFSITIVADLAIGFVIGVAISLVRRSLKQR